MSDPVSEPAFQSHFPLPAPTREEEILQRLRYVGVGKAQRLQRYLFFIFMAR